MKGLQLPLIPDNKGNLSTLNTTQDITDQNIKNFLLSNRGSRVMRRNLGIGLKRYIGEFLTDALKNNIAQMVKDHVIQSFKNIKKINVYVEQERENNYDIIVSYVLRGDIGENFHRKIKVRIQ